MEPKRKLAATDGFRGDGGCSERKRDRLSNLPDPVAHHILSFLNVSDLARLSCVSKCCREFCFSTPFLNFDRHDYKSDETTCVRWLGLLNSLERFLFLRGDQKIERFCFCWISHDVSETCQRIPCFCRDQVSYRMISWIHNAVRCNVERLNLVFEEGHLRFPSSIFRCESLRYLLVHMNRLIIKVASSFACSSNLQYLELTKVHILDEGFFNWISCSCKYIQELHLRDVYEVKNITIETSSLKTFYLRTPHSLDTLNISGEKLEDVLVQTWASSSPSFNSSSIFAPNLKKFSWSGKLAEHSSFGNLECLEYAEIYLEPNVDDCGNVFEFLRSLCRGKIVLTLNEETIQVLALYKEDVMLAPFNYISWLHLNLYSSIEDIVAEMASLLRRIPNLNGLCIKYDLPPLDLEEEDSSPDIPLDDGYWKMQNLAFINELKYFMIIVPDEFTGVEFARYILECAKKLEIADITCSTGNLEEVKRMLEKSKMISNATVVFHDEFHF